MAAESDDKPRISLGFDWFWISVAAMAIAMMHYGYSCTGFAKCKAPAQEQGARDDR